MCSSLNEILEVFKGKYHKFRCLFDNIKSITPDDQFRNKESARNLLDDMKSMLIERIEQIKNEDCPREKSMLSGLYYLHGSVSMDMDETPLAQESLHKSMELTNNDPLHVDNILVVVSCLNQLGLLWCERGDYNKALEYLRECEQFYINFSSDVGPTEFEKLLTGVDGKVSGEEGLEKIHTLTLYYLAQALGASGDSVNAAAYCHRTLKRQLSSSSLDKADWALNAATLSQVLVERNAFKEARNHLAAASQMLELLKSDLDNHVPDCKHHQAELDVLSERKAEVARCWAKYCLNLLTISRDRLLDDSSEAITTPVELENLVFDLSHTGQYEEGISCSFALVWNDAISLYRHGISWLEKAGQHYTLEDHASDHASIIRDHSQLYMVLAFFNEDVASQCKMHKRRLDMLVSLSSGLSEKYYIDLLRQIWFEMGETYITLIDLKMDQVTDDKNYITKVNNLVKQAVAIFQKFVSSFNDRKVNQRYDEIYEQSIILAKIHIAKLATKFQTDDTNLLIQYNTLAYNSYKEIVEYCDKWTDPEPLGKNELRACREMANLLPLKLGKLMTKNQQ